MLTLHVLKPSVNNMAVRVMLRAANLEFTEADVYGHTRSPEFLAKCPAHMTPLLEGDGLPKGVLWESCAIMQYLCDKHGLSKFYPTDPVARAKTNSAMFYTTGTLYPLVARSTYPALGFPLYPGEVGASDADATAKAAASKASQEAVAEPLSVFHAWYLDGKKFIGGDHPTIADIRLASTLEFLPVVDYALPAWAKSYIGDMEKSLGKAYAEPAADVRGYIGYVRSQKK
jgi:glutathione S-transferase